MIYLLTKVDQKFEVLVYQNLADLILRVEWQDICEGNDIISDLEGNIYVWDRSKEEEIGTVHDYSLVPTGEKFEFIDKLNETYASFVGVEEFEIEI